MKTQEKVRFKKITIPVGPYQCNCCIVYDEHSNHAFLVDPGDEAETILSELEEKKLKPLFAFHTHAHFDHIAASSKLKKSFPEMQILLHKADYFLFQNLKMQGQMFGYEFDEAPPVDRFICDEEEINFEGSSFSVIHTPGHSPGGVCLQCSENIIEERPFLFSGDTLFHRSIGRTDLWEGNFNQLKISIKDKLFNLDLETGVLPGHGPMTSVGEEKKSNPFL